MYKSSPFWSTLSHWYILQIIWLLELPEAAQFHRPFTPRFDFLPHHFELVTVLNGLGEKGKDCVHPSSPPVETLWLSGSTTLGWNRSGPSNCPYHEPSSSQGISRHFQNYQHQILWALGAPSAGISSEVPGALDPLILGMLGWSAMTRHDGDGQNDQKPKNILRCAQNFFKLGWPHELEFCPQAAPIFCMGPSYIEKYKSHI